MSVSPAAHLPPSGVVGARLAAYSDVHINRALDPPPVAVYFQGMLAKEQISRMSSSERVEAMELLWESFSTEGIDYPSPDWHGKILAERSESIDSGKATWLSVNELQARLTSR